ncbi:MAG: gliding motility lipoprotein GldH [Bacteroidota bacterium]
MKKYKTLWLFLLIATLALAACDPGRIYDQSYAIDGEGWDRDTVFHYEVSIEDSLQLHNFYIGIRNNTDYPYSNIYIFMTTEFPNGHATTDTIECILADKGGRWLGDGTGRIKDNLIMLQHSLRFPINGKYHFYLEQGMRESPLVGIEDIGLRVEKSN